MVDFVKGNCKAIDDKNKFVEDWLETNRDPCSICATDKSRCSYYKQLADGDILQEKNLPKGSH